MEQPDHPAGLPTPGPAANGDRAVGTPREGRWYDVSADPVLRPIGARRAYTEVILVYLAFFAVGIVAAALLLGNRTADLRDTGSWGVYMPAAVNIVTQIGLAVAVVLLLGARRGVTPAVLGLRMARRGDGRPAVSQSIRVMGWCFFAIIVGGIINASLQTGSLPKFQSNAPSLIFAMFDSMQAGVIEELVVLAFLVVTLRQAGRPWWEVTVVALVLRAAYHIYYGPGVVGILVWAALFYWIYLRFRQLWPMMICHALWDAVAFLSRPAPAVAGVGFGLVLLLWIVCLVLWLVARGDRGVRPAYPPALWSGAGGASPGWQGGGGSGVDGTPAAGDPPPGWHPDPAGANRWRWWDGQRWTDHVSTHS